MGKQKKAETEPPAHLSREARALWRRVALTWEMTGQHLELLRVACESFDRREQARKILEKEGPVYSDRFGCPRAHPAVAQERNAQVVFLRAWRELRFSDEESKEEDNWPEVKDGHEKTSTT